MAYPKKTDETAIRRGYSLRIARELYDRIAAAAAAAGVTVPVWIAAICHAHLSRRHPEPRRGSAPHEAEP